MEYYGSASCYTPHLAHHGIKGQRWGVRKYQNSDGTLTPEGRERYGITGRSGIGNESNNDGSHRKLKTAAKVAAGVGAAALAAYGIHKAVTDGDEALGDMVERLKVNSYRMKDSMKAFKLSDDELARRVERLKQEQEYVRLVRDSVIDTSNPHTKMFMDAGRKTMQTVLSGAGMYAIKAVLTKQMDRKDAASYITPKPKTK